MQNIKRGIFLLVVTSLIVSGLVAPHHQLVMGAIQMRGTATTASTTAVKASNGTRPGTFERILIVNFENQPFDLTMMHEYFKEVATKIGTLLSDYYGVTHPSQPNYLSQIAGDYFKHNTDSNVNVNATTLVDLLEAKGLTWKSYQENYPKANSGTGNCFVDQYSTDKKYYRKHNPFMTFDNIRNNPNRCKNIVNSDQLDLDIASGSLPNLMYYTPNIDNDAHNTGLDYANNYLSKWLPPKLNNPKFMKGTLIFITFDEDDYMFHNHIYAVAIGDMVQAGGVDKNGPYNHFSLLRTIEDNFQLGNLGRNDATASSFNCFKY